jgi:hypothetical protein
MQVDFTKAASAYAEKLGWAVFPLVKGRKVPAIAKSDGGKGVKDATRYLDDIERWGRKYPDANIGIACGIPSGIMVIDVDPRNGGPESLAALASKGQVLTPCPRARTGNGGWHFIYRYQPGIINSKSKLGPGIDIKTTGGYIVGAPSWIAKSEDGAGGQYQWEVSPLDVAVPRLPIWVSSRMTPRPAHAHPPSFALPSFSGSSQDPVAPLIRYVQQSGTGRRNDSLYWASCRAAELIRSHKVGESATVNRLFQAALACGLDGKESIKTINSALKMTGVR